MDYKDKLRLAKEALDSGSYDKETIEYIFPELAESEESSAFKDKLLELFQKFRYIKESVPTNGDIIDYVDAHIQELIDTMQKPTEWSDEDYVMQRAALEILMASPKLVASTILKESVIVWLKSIKDRIQPQPRHEWSEEDEHTLNYIINCAEAGMYIDKRSIDWLRNKLSSIRPWKPSEEQIVVLNDIIINGHLSNANERILKGLQEQLKKLKE